MVPVSRTSGSAYNLPRSLRNSGTLLTSKGATISAQNGDITLVVMNDGCAAYLALPKDALGNEYYALTWKPGTTEMSLVLVSATQDNTNVEIMIPVNQNIVINFGGITYTGGQTLNTLLSKDQTLQIAVSNADLSGLHIRANNPIAVVSGNSKVVIPNGLAADDLLMQLPPVSSWGRQFYLTPFPSDNIGGSIKVIASEPGTTVSINGRDNFNSQAFSRYISNAGESWQQQIGPGGAFSITSNKPVQVVYFTASEPGTNTIGRPSGLLLPAKSQFLESYSIKSRDSQYTEYVLVVIEDRYRARLLLDDAPVPQDSWVDIGSGTNVKGKALRLTGVQAHTLRHNTPGVTFGAYVYGYRRGNCAYAYPAGLKLGGISVSIFYSIFQCNVN